MSVSNRNYGIDLLRIVSMIMIVFLHVLGHGGLLKNTDSIAKNTVIDFFETASFCAVNCYGMISGYVGYGKKFNFKGIIQLWIEVVFYLCIINFIFYFASPGSVTLGNIVTSFIPVSADKYWYFTAFFALYFFKPFLNKAVEALDKKGVAALIIVCIFIFSVFPIFGGRYFGGDIFRVIFGYSPVWLFILYTIGACIKKYDFSSKTNKKVLLTVYLFCVLVMLFGNIVLNKIIRLNPSMSRYLFVINYLIDVNYDAPLVVLCGLSLFLLFIDLDIDTKLKKAIAFFAPTTFGVYIIHLHPNIWRILDGAFAFFNDYNIVSMTALIVCTVLGIWFVCSMIDRLRILLFRMIKADRLSGSLEKIMNAIQNKILKKIVKYME